MGWKGGNHDRERGVFSARGEPVMEINKKRMEKKRDRSEGREVQDRVSSFILSRWFDNCCCSQYFLCLQSVHFNENQTPACGAHWRAHTHTHTHRHTHAHTRTHIQYLQFKESISHLRVFAYVCLYRVYRGSCDLN